MESTDIIQKNSSRVPTENSNLILNDILSIILNVLKGTISILPEINKNTLECKISVADCEPILTLAYKNNIKEIDTPLVLNNNSPSSDFSDEANHLFPSRLNENRNLLGLVNKDHFGQMKIKLIDPTILMNGVSSSFDFTLKGMKIGVVNSNILDDLFSIILNFLAGTSGISFNAQQNFEYVISGISVQTPNLILRYSSSPFELKTCQSNNNQEHTSNKLFTYQTLDPPQNLGENQCNDKNLEEVPSKSSTDTRERPFKCGYCTKAFCDILNKVRHERVHTGEKPRSVRLENLKTEKEPYNFQYFGKGFSKFHKQQYERNFSQMKKHSVNTDCSEEKPPYKCNYCEKFFTYSSSVKMHERIHTGEKPYKCKYCNKCFSYSGQVQRHLIEDHKGVYEKIRTGKKPYKCIICEKSFSLPHHLKEHFRIHTGEKPFKCKYCEKCFSRSGCLKKHELIHTGEKPHRCRLCNKCFSRTGSMKRHELTHWKI